MVVEHAHGLRQRRGPNAKSSLHKAHLAPDAGLQAPGASLSFAQGSHDFESLDRGIGRGDRFETAHRLDQYLELSVIGLDHVIEILHLPVGRLPVQLSFALQFGDRCTIARRFVGIERGRLFPVLQASQGLAQEPLRCLGAAGRRQVEIDRVAPLVDCPVQVGPLAPHLDVGFIQAPARIKATPPEPAQPLLHLRGVALDPAIDRRMVDRNAAFRQHFLKVAIADRIATIPAHRPQDHITLEMAPLEIRHRSVRPISAKHAQASRFLQQSPSAFTRTKGGEAPPLIRPPEISPRQAEGRASLTGPKSPARASAAMTAAALSRVDDGSGGYRQPLAQPRHRGRTASDLEATGPSHPDMDLDARTDVRFRVLGVLR